MALNDIHDLVYYGVLIMYTFIPVPTPFGELKRGRVLIMNCGVLLKIHPLIDLHNNMIIVDLSWHQEKNVRNSFPVVTSL